MRPEGIAGLESLLDDPDSFLRGSVKMLADSELVTMGVVSLGKNAPQLLLRRLNYGRIRHQLRDTFRTSRAERAFDHGLAMELAGVPTPQVIAVATKRVLRRPVCAYLLTEFIPRATTLEDVLNKQAKLSVKQIRQLAGLMASLHASGFSHRDLKSSNILYDEKLEPCFIDLDGVRRYETLSWDRMIKDLVRLGMEFTGKGLVKSAPWFLKCYCRKRGMVGDFRRIHQAVSEKLAPIIAAQSARKKSR